MSIGVLPLLGIHEKCEDHTADETNKENFELRSRCVECLQPSRRRSEVFNFFNKKLLERMKVWKKCVRRTLFLCEIAY